jgi:hypothetical protein
LSGQLQSALYRERLVAHWGSCELLAGGALAVVSMQRMPGFPDR